MEWVLLWPVEDQAELFADEPDEDQPHDLRSLTDCYLTQNVWSKPSFNPEVFTIQPNMSVVVQLGRPGVPGDYDDDGIDDPDQNMRSRMPKPKPGWTHNQFALFFQFGLVGETLHGSCVAILFSRTWGWKTHLAMKTSFHEQSACSFASRPLAFFSAFLFGISPPTSAWGSSATLND